MRIEYNDGACVKEADKLVFTNQWLWCRIWFVWTICAGGTAVTPEAAPTGRIRKSERGPLIDQAWSITRPTQYAARPCS